MLGVLQQRNGEVYCHGLLASDLRGSGNVDLIGSQRDDRSLPLHVAGDVDLSRSEMGRISLREAQIEGRLLLDGLRCLELDATETTVRQGVSGDDVQVESSLGFVRCNASSVELRAVAAGATDFSETTLGHASLEGKLGERALFNHSKIRGDLRCPGALFGGHVSLVAARIGGNVDLNGVGDISSLDARSLNVLGDLDLRGRLISRSLDLGKASVGGAVRLSGGTVASTAGFEQMKVSGGIDFRRCRFLGQTDFSAAEIEGEHADLSDVTTDRRVDLAVRCTTVDLLGAHFRDGLDLRLGDTAVRLDATRFDAMSSISGPALERAKVVSLYRARLRGLTLAHVDLSYCLMGGAIDLDQLSLGEGVWFHRAPQPILGRWGARGRQVIADEVEWRRWGSGGPTWKGEKRPRELQPERLRSERKPLPAAAVEELYRALRTGRERSGNSPGAADFYYGEMEMRRRRPWSDGWAERAIVWAYWATSGYALRASRALLALLVLWGLGVFYFSQLGGLVGCASLDETIVLTASSGLAFVHAPPDNLALSTGGEGAQLVLRVGTAILLALAALALRGRVKR